MQDGRALSEVASCCILDHARGMRQHHQKCSWHRAGSAVNEALHMSQVCVVLVHDDGMQCAVAIKWQLAGRIAMSCRAFVLTTPSGCAELQDGNISAVLTCHH